jgi:hypothetical protein
VEFIYYRTVGGVYLLQDSRRRELLYNRTAGGVGITITSGGVNIL